MNSNEMHICDFMEESVTIPRWFFDSLLWHIDALHERIVKHPLDADTDE